MPFPLNIVGKLYNVKFLLSCLLWVFAGQRVGKISIRDLPESKLSENTVGKCKETMGCVLLRKTIQKFNSNSNKMLTLFYLVYKSK